MHMKNKIFFCLFFLLLGMVLDCSHVLAERSFRIGEVNIRGNNRVEVGTILNSVKVKSGMTVSEAMIDEDVRAIYQLGRFRDVVADVSQEGGVTVLTYTVKEYPVVRKVEITGNKKLKKADLETALAVNAPDFLNPQRIEQGIANLRRKYHKEGYYAVEISSDTELVNNNEAILNVKIKEGVKNRIEKIVFNGNTVVSDRKLKKAMESGEKVFLLSWMFDGAKYSEEAARIDRERIADEYFNRGYIDVVVSEPRIELTKDRDGLILTYDIEEGKQYHIEKIDITGDLLTDRETLLKLLKVKDGDVFSRKNMRESITALSDYYADRGYAFVNVSPKTSVNKAERAVTVDLDVEEGSLVHFDHIRIRGNTKTRDKVIRREMRFKEGDLYSASGLKKSQQRIKNLGFFEEVSVSTSKGKSPTLLDVDVDVKEQPSGSISAGVGYSSMDGFIVQGMASQENFLGLGLQGIVAAGLGGSSNTFRVGLMDPYFLDKNMQLGFDLYKTEREWDDFTRDAIGGDIKLGIPFYSDNRITFIYRYEKKKISDVDDDASYYIRSQEGRSTLSSITAILSRDTRDYKLDPSSGYLSSASVEYAGIGGSEHFVKYIASHRHFFPFKWDTVFSINGEIGYIQEVNNEPIPIDEKFFLGGMYSIRGFDYRKVGPRDPETGDYLGGVKEAFFNFEFIFPLLKDIKMKGVVFFDTGNSWSDDQEYFSDMRYSVGTGIRWMSPMGPLRIEWGYNLDPKDGESRSEVDFSIGRMF
jgi:outer membrane protein insertion porin family